MIDRRSTGWLTKQGGFIKSWKRRYFVLNERVLTYYDKVDGAKKGIVDLTQAKKVDVDSTCKKQPALQIITANRTYLMVGDSAKERDEWVLSLRDAIQKSQIAHSSSTAAIPQTPVKKIGIEDFVIVKVLGRGTYGKVQLVRNKVDNQLYAMKTLSKKLLHEYDQIEQSLTERNVLLQTVHPFLVGAHFTFQTDQKLFMVLDYVAGGELFTRLRSETRFSEPRARLYASEVLLGLGHLHSLGFVYRDLKPENILVDLTGHLKITDFGLVKGQMKDGTTSTFCGTPEYIAPEMLDMAPYTKSVDWWSYGILIYELCVGSAPFFDENTHKLYRMIMEDPVQYPDWLSKEIKDLIGKLLNRDPGRRLGSGPTDLEEIKLHPWFKDVDWEAVFERKIKPEWIPNIKNAEDTSLFDELFTKEEAAVSIENGIGVGSVVQREFDGFTFAQPAKLSTNK